MSVTLEGMRIFVTVAETGGFSAAATALGSTQPTISRQVSQLEHALGVQLFRRSTRKLVLTEAGRIYLDRVEAIIADTDEATSVIRTHKAEVSGLLRVSAPTTLGQRRIAPILKSFLEQHPELEVGFYLSDSYRDLLEHSYDVAIRFGQQKTSDLSAVKIADSRSVIAAASSYLQEHGPIEHPSNLASLNCLRFRQGPGESVWHFEKAKKPVSVPVKGALYSDTAEALLAASVAGLGVVQLPIWMLEEPLKRNLLEEVLSEWRIIPHTAPVFAVFPERKNRSQKINAFVEYLINAFKQDAWKLD